MVSPVEHGCISEILVSFHLGAQFSTKPWLWEKKCIKNLRPNTLFRPYEAVNPPETIPISPYCWWKNSTTWDVKNPVNNGTGYFTYQLLQDFFHQPCHFDFFQGTTQEGSPSTLLHRCPSQWWWTETPKSFLPIFCREIMGEIQNPTNTLAFYGMFLFL